MHVFRLTGDFETLDAYTPLFFDLGARGMEEKEGEVWVYFPTRVELPLPGEWLELEDEDWLEAWKRDLQPVRAGPFVVLAPWHTWEGPERRIVLEPGMAFGTGHHETTRMALEALAREPIHGARVLDLGTGSGILAIAAAMRGAEVLGVDVDASVIPQAEANARRNQAPARFKVGSLEAAEPPYDLVVANLYAELHQTLAPRYAEILRPGGRALLTGILAEREAGVLRAMEDAGFSLLSRRQEGEWVLLAFRYSPED